MLGEVKLKELRKGDLASVKRARREIEALHRAQSILRKLAGKVPKKLQNPKLSRLHIAVLLTIRSRLPVAHHPQMSRKLTLFPLAVMILSQHTIFAATDVNEGGSKSRSISEEEARTFAIYAPIPRYPYEARVKHMQGSGLALLTVDRRTGYVTSARMLESTQHQILDDEAVKAFRAWRFKPETVSVVRIPVLFGMRRTQLVPGGGAMYGLKPEYPREARVKGLTGKGVVSMKIDPRTGYVRSAWMQKSTGHRILDDAALQALRQWRFKPRTLTTVDVPIQFTTKGVVY
jgi:TonB family protein